MEFSAQPNTVLELKKPVSHKVRPSGWGHCSWLRELKICCCGSAGICKNSHSPCSSWKLVVLCFSWKAGFDYSSSVTKLQVWVDPAGHRDSEESRGLLQRADTTADRVLPAQVNSKLTCCQDFSVLPSADITNTSVCHSWLKVTEHLTDRNMPVLQPGMKVRNR